MAKKHNKKLMSIADLVHKYEANRDAYLRPEYNETQLRTDFLDPFFELLGWDIKNSQGKSTYEREVLVEESIREDANSNAKKPDYTFRLFAERKFFLEAKKPRVRIDTDGEPAKQIRRYGFTAKLKISVLSNFEYLAIYDCSQPVTNDDNARTGRINIYHYSEYEEAFDAIRTQLSHEVVYSGEFEETWNAIEEQLKLVSVDSLFLDQINQWRIILGREIYNHKKDLDSLQLNDLVQSYINSIVFLRVCEDRDLEVYQTLLNYATNEDFNALIEKFRMADRRYNAGLFSHPLTSEIITNSQSAFWQIIQQLYFPESVYSFSVLASDILGNIYEIFLAKRLQINNDEIALVNKPENEDRDIVTTPTFIINNILRETVTNYCVGKTDQEIMSIKLGDIACGSGAFLLEGYQLLQDTLVDYYLENDPDQLVQTAPSTYKLPFETKSRLMVNCIYGVDKDYNAVQASKFGLLLKLLEGEREGTIPTPALPSLDNNIQFGNSLLENESVPERQRREINSFNFGELKFDVIVGNPPYMSTEHMNQLTPLEVPLYNKIYQSAFKQYDKYFLFIERGYNLLVDGGYLGYIVPSKFTKVGAGKGLREYLKDQNCVKEVVSFGANQIFQDKTTYTCLLILQKAQQEYLEYCEVQSLSAWTTRNVDEQLFDNVGFEELDSNGWALVPGEFKEIYQAILNQSLTLEELLGDDNINNGIQTSATRIYIQTPSKQDEVYVYFRKDGIEWKVERELTRPYFKTSKGEDNLNTYRPFAPNAIVIYPYLKTDNGVEFVQIDKLKADYPFLYAYLHHYKDNLSNPKRNVKPVPKTEHEWYRYGRHQNLDKCDVPAKIIVGVLSQGDKYAIDYERTLISSGGTAGYCMITVPEENPHSIYYIQALLNSKYLEWCSAIYGEVFRGGFIARGTKVLKRLPIRVIDFDNQDEVSIHNEITELQKSLIELQGRIDANRGNPRESIRLKREFIFNKRKVDQLLKRLFNLGEDDSKIPLISDLYAID